MKSEKYLRLLANDYTTIEKASIEVTKLTAISVLPKGTEYFLSDLHGQYDAFTRILRSASGNTREKISLEFKDSISEDEKNQLSNLIYEPTKFISLLKETGDYDSDWVRTVIIQLIRLTKRVSSKYSRQKVRGTIPSNYVDLIEEMLNANFQELNKKYYLNTLITTMIEIGSCDEFIITLCHLIQELSVDHLHIIGDIYDRGPRPDIIMDILMEKRNVDIQWGNHDIIWIGAAFGSEALMANVVRNALSYNNFDSLEDAYGINLRPLSNFAAEVYHDDSCERFKPRTLDKNKYDVVDEMLAAKMYKAISIIQFKLTGQLIDRNPELKMEHRNVMKTVDFRNAIYTDKNGNKHKMLDTNFPTIDPDDPLKLTLEEEQVMHSLKASFKHSKKLQTHARFLISKGSTYKVINSNLLFHGCIPMNEDGTFQSLEYEGKTYSGKTLMDFFDEKAREALFLPDKSKKRQKAVDMYWYLWCGPKSPMFGKSQLSAFENFFVNDKEARREINNPYYKLSKQEKYVDMIFEEFGMDKETSHIINGHVPVKLKDGEKPISANGKVYVIDGGISKAYQPKTGIAGYTLTFNSHHLALAEHSNYEVMETVHGAYTPRLLITEKFPKRILIRDTDEGREILEKIKDLKALIKAYKQGIIKEKSKITE